MEQQRAHFCERCHGQIDTTPLRPVNPNLLHSKHVPSKAEETEMLRLLQIETKELEQVKSSIASLRQYLRQMEDKQRNLETRIEQRRCAVSVQRRVPIELWNEIFAIVCSEGRGHSLEMCGEKNLVLMNPIILGQVCSRWRDIAVSSPRLWASISVEIDATFISGAERIIQTFIENAGTYPLDLEI
ncbi:hypothetical protein L218DRAFT_869272, partial [Marasmius fiardii PR-910]